MRIECVCLFLVKDVWKVVVLFWNRGEVDRCIRGHGVGLCSHLRKGKLEDFSTVHPADAAALMRAIFGASSFGGSLQGAGVRVAREVEACRGGDVGGDFRACGVVLNEILPSTQSIDRL